MICSKTIANHEFYTIYSNGLVYSGITDTVLKPRKNKNGYLIVCLNGKQPSIHRLVASHFLPNPYNYKYVNHKDGDKTNNDVSNLEWCSAEQNNQHALITGLRKGYVHADVKRVFLQRYLDGEYIKDLSTEIGNHPNTLSRMLREQSKKEGKYHLWVEESKRKRKETAIRNLELINDKD